jgi:hypothetical protein
MFQKEIEEVGTCWKENVFTRLDGTVSAGTMHLAMKICQGIASSFSMGQTRIKDLEALRLRGLEISS